MRLGPERRVWGLTGTSGALSRADLEEEGGRGPSAARAQRCPAGAFALLMRAPSHGEDEELP